MPRQRMVKPEFFESGSLAECTRDARLLFIGLWVVANDKGNIKLEERKLVKQLFPFDDLDPRMMFVWLAELEDVGCIKVYEAHGDVCISIPNFLVYQSIKHPSKTTIPAPPDGLREGPRTTWFTERVKRLYGIANPHIPPCFGSGSSTIGNGEGTVVCTTTHPQLTHNFTLNKELTKEVISSSPLGEEEEITPEDLPGEDPGSEVENPGCPECGSLHPIKAQGEHLVACLTCGAVWERRDVDG